MQKTVLMAIQITLLCDPICHFTDPTLTSVANINIKLIQSGNFNRGNAHLQLIPK